MAMPKLFTGRGHSLAVLVALIISITTPMRPVAGGIFGTKPANTSIEYLHKQFNKIIEPVRVMFLYFKGCAMEFIKLRDHDKLTHCVSEAFSYTGLGESAPLKAFQAKFQATFQVTCRALSQLLNQKGGSGTLSMAAVEEAEVGEEKSEKLREIISSNAACNVISEELDVAEVYATYSGKVN